MSDIICGAIITNGGNSTRFDSDIKKEFHKFKDKSILYYSVLPFTKLKFYKHIVVTYPENLLRETKESLYELKDRVIYVQGSDTRQKSVYNGLLELKKYNLDIVSIHDGCRCFITEPLIIDNLAVCKVFGSSTTATMTTDTIKRINTFGVIIEHIKRSGLVNVQTPQSFNFQEILEAHEKASKSDKEYTDDTEIYSDYTNKQVAISMGSVKNKKITFIEDIDA